jgi:hypothetical protein
MLLAFETKQLSKAFVSNSRKQDVTFTSRDFTRKHEHRRDTNIGNKAN